MAHLLRLGYGVGLYIKLARLCCSGQGLTMLMGLNLMAYMSRNEATLVRHFALAASAKGYPQLKL